jgi:hypothetical protein
LFASNKKGHSNVTIDVSYFGNGEGAVYTASDTLAGDELIAANKRVMSRAVAEKSLRYVFFDCNNITGVSVSNAQLREIALTDVSASKQMEKPIVVAIYAKDDLPFALSRMWEVYVEAAGWSTAVFRSKPKAITWLKEKVSAKFDTVGAPN